MANTDVSVCGDTNAVINYIAKYCSKAETQSLSYRDIVKSVLPNINPQHPRLSLVQRLMNKLIAERDISGQELQHYVQALPLVCSSRETISVDCRPSDIQQHHFFALGGEILAGKSALQRYKDRNQEKAAGVSPLRIRDGIQQGTLSAQGSSSYSHIQTIV